jgi:hypothetical protein
MAKSPAFEQDVMLLNGSLGASIKTDPYQTSLIKRYSIQATLSGTPVGNIKLQVSDVGGTNDADWADYPSSQVNLTGTANTPLIWDIRDTATDFVRVVYTRTSGTGTITIRLSRK